MTSSDAGNESVGYFDNPFDTVEPIDNLFQPYDPQVVLYVLEFYINGEKRGLTSYSLLRPNPTHVVCFYSEEHEQEVGYMLLRLSPHSASVWQVSSKVIFLPIKVGGEVYEESADVDSFADLADTNDWYRDLP